MPAKIFDSTPLYAYDAGQRAAHGLLCGVDEAGRGPLCGPVCCAAVVLNPDDPIPGVADSKKLSPKRRDALFEEIRARALAYHVAFVSPQEIDARNILWATMAGMARAVAALGTQPAFVLVDGNRCPPDLAGASRRQGGCDERLNRGGVDPGQGQPGPLHGRAGQALPPI